MTPKELAAVVAALAVTASIAAYSLKGDPDPLEVQSLADVEESLPPSSVYRIQKPDSGFGYVAKYKRPVQSNTNISVMLGLEGAAPAKEEPPAMEDVTVYLDESPCAWRAVETDNCYKLDGGLASIRATMQAGQWVGEGCTRKACVIISGERE